ncbi:MAG: hypothetical protein R2809_07175 [Flavobacteriales bacterium]
MKKIILAIVLSIVALFGNTQTDSTAKSSSTEGFGVLMGVIYGNLRAKTNAQFIPGSNKVLTAWPVGAVGLNVGLFYEYKGIPRWSIRPSLEANVVNPHMKYDVQKFNLEEGYIFPLAIDIAVDAMYHPRRKHVPSIMFGVRPVFGLKEFQGTVPETGTFSMNADLGISKNFKAGTHTMRVELSYSFGLLNIIGEKKDDPYTSSISNLYRDIAALKLYFN